MSDKKPEGGDEKIPGKNHSDTPTILYIGLTIAEVPFAVEDYKVLVAQQNSVCQDMHGLEEARPVLGEDISKADTVLRSARAAERMNETCIAELKDELVRVTESGARGVLRKECLVREEFLRGKIYVYDNATNTLLSERVANDKEHAKASEFRDPDGKPMSGMLEPAFERLTPRERAKRLLDDEGGKKTKKSAETKDKQEDNKTTVSGAEDTSGVSADPAAPAPTPRGKRSRPVPISITDPPTAPAGDRPSPAP